MSVQFLQREGFPALAYRFQKGTDETSPLVMFCGGFRSDMEGTKAAFLAQECEKHGYGYIRFDYRGHGQSEGIFEDGTIGLWKEDALAILDMAGQRDIIIVGSSMGGWISLLCALERKERVVGLVGLAAAPDFTRDIQNKVTPEQQADLRAQGWIGIENDYGAPYKIMQSLIDDGEAHCLLHGAINLSIPVRLLQGMKDTDVEWQTAHRINNALISQDKKVYLIEDGDHRLSRPEDLAMVWQCVEEVTPKN